jgi:hypothetical protein
MGGTLRALKAIRRELADPAIAAHHGRIVKTAGDGILIEFASVVDAVACAVAIQEGMMARNAGIPEGRGRPLPMIVWSYGDLIEMASAPHTSPRYAVYRRDAPAGKREEKPIHPRHLAFRQPRSVLQLSAGAVRT